MELVITYEALMLAWRYLRTKEWFQRSEHKNMFHANPRDYVRIEPENGDLIEHENLCPRPESLYALCDEDYVYETFKDDIIVNMLATQQGVREIDFSAMKKMASTLDVRTDFSTFDACSKTSQVLHIAYGLCASSLIMKKTKVFCEKKGKELLVILSYAPELVVEACEGRLRRDQDFLRFLEEEGIPFVYMLTKHTDDFKAF